MRVEDVLQDLEYDGELKVGTRFAATGPALIAIDGITDPGRWGEGYLDVAIRDVSTDRTAVKIVAKTRNTHREES
jgi:hypothetical protein